MGPNTVTTPLIGQPPTSPNIVTVSAMEVGSLQKHPRSWHLAQYYWLFFTNYNCPINHKWRTELTQWAGSTSQVKSVIMRPKHRASQATPGPVATSSQPASQPPRLTSLPFSQCLLVELSRRMLQLPTLLLSACSSNLPTKGSESSGSPFFVLS